MSASDGFAELAAALCIPENGIVVTVFAYFDESGTDGQHDITIISGFAARLSDWLAFNGRWRAQLDDDNIKTFHYVECRGGNRQYRGWDRPASDRHLDKLAMQIASSPLGAITAGFMGNYERALARNPLGDQAAIRFPTAYAFVFEMLIDKIRREVGTGEKISLVFARQTQSQSRALEVYNWHRDRGHWPEISTLTYAEPEEVIPLQPADMIAWETRRYLWNKNPDSWRGLPLLKRLIPKNEKDGATIYEVAYTEDALANFDFSIPKPTGQAEA